ncbi:Ribosomal protein L13E [Ignisphaera aggregans DSM 17230]|uniref:Large ribosomal subunit protein eL13 n=1 Tax=Ignisphaera aggregans (strain DSM 17230 / JCM 13409 / AQ1.S1) TaxID=583356 RepID=E0SPJ3_IGNAA|nr:Ribosomal protein L13E [Ignisphaera aggregans DSM 17230]
MDEGCCINIEIPGPIVKKPRLIKFRGIDTGTRIGRGYSIGELKAANISLSLAKQLNIPLDPRRKSVHEENVENLKKVLEQLSEVIRAKKTKPARLVVKAKTS